MSSTLQQLFSGSLCPQQDEDRDGLGCSAIYEPVHRQQNRFREALDSRAPELVDKFDVLTDDFFLAYDRQTETMFYRGFGLAVKLLAEGLSV